MFWYKSWLDTRWRFLIAFVVLVCSAVLTVLAYPKFLELLPVAMRVNLGGEIGRRVTETIQFERDYRGYIWVQSFRQNLTQMGTLFAVLLGTGGLLPSGSKDTALFTMSLPASRNELLGIRAATGLLELAVLAFAPALVFPLLSPTVGQTFSVASAIMHGACLFITWAVFFSLALLLSTVVAGIWIPAVVAICVGFFLMAVDLVAGGTGRFNIFAVMSGEHYFRTGALPWVGLAVSAAASAAMLYAGARNFARQDF
jgi:ABC-type transport system involved in multi-copper enzyme maturation permease subunit